MVHFHSSLSGCLYYVIFIDDFTSFCWLYPISNKSDVYATFVKFKILVKKQFNYPTKQLQSDNVCEYCSTIFKQFLSDNGIFHRLSCLQTSKKNGLAERKHRHIVEMGLTLLTQSGLATKFWVDAFLTSIFIINRLPTKVLNFSSPFECLFHLPPDLAIFVPLGVNAFRVFDLTCLINSLTVAHHAFSLVIVLIRRGFIAMILPPDVCIFPEM